MTSSKNSHVLVCKYSVKKLREKTVNGDRDMHGIVVVRTSIYAKHEGIGLAGPHTNGAGGGGGEGGAFFPVSKTLNSCLCRHGLVARSDFLSPTGRSPRTALRLGNCASVPQAGIGAAVATARPKGGSPEAGASLTPQKLARCPQENLLCGQPPFLLQY